MFLMRVAVSVINKNMALETDKLLFGPKLCHLPALWLHMDFFAPLSFHFLNGFSNSAHITV